MFANTQMPAINLGFPDACKVPVPPAVVVIPFPNIALTAMATPNVFNQFISAMPVHNLLTTIPLSNGDEPGVLGGVVSSMFIGPSRHLLGSFKVFKSCMPSTKMLCPSGQNGAALNIPGLTLTPSQLKVMELA